MIKSKRTIAAMIALLAWIALILQLYILIHNTPGNGMTPWEAVGRFLIFFTILTNLLVAISCTTVLFGEHTTASHFFGKPSVITAITVYIFFVGLVYNISLRFAWHPKGLQKIADELLHVVVPVLFIVYWIFYASKSPLKWAYAFQWLIYPAIYLVYAMVRGRIGGFYPYPFLDANVLTFGNIAANCAALLSVFIITGSLFIAIGKRMSRTIQ